MSKHTPTTHDVIGAETDTEDVPEAGSLPPFSERFAELREREPDEPTSLDKIGALHTRRADVLEFVVRNGPASASDVVEATGANGPRMKLNELRRKGLIEREVVRIGNDKMFQYSLESDIDPADALEALGGGR